MSLGPPEAEKCVFRQSQLKWLKEPERVDSQNFTGKAQFLQETRESSWGCKSRANTINDMPINCQLSCKKV